MKTKSIMLTLLAGFAVMGLRAQQISYDLGKYKLPVVSRKQLDFNFNMSGNNSTNLLTNTDEDAHQNNYSSNVRMTYQSYLNTERFQKSLSSTGSFGSYYYNQKDDHKYSNFSISPSFNVSSVNRIFNVKQRFLELDYTLQYNYNGNHDKNTDSTGTSTSTYKYNNGLAQLPIKIGIGRIEEVEDARQAIYILNKLNEKQCLNKTISDEDIEKFASLISSLKRERILDYRLHKIAELEAVDSFMRSHNYLKNAGIAYFATLNDLWDYGSQQIRKSGSSIALAIYPTLGLNYRTYKSENFDYDVKSSLLALNGGLEYTLEKPVSLAFQSGTNFSLLYGINQFKIYDPDQIFKLPNIQSKIEQRLGFYPNTRTSIDFSIAGTVIRCFDVSTDNSQFSGLDAFGIFLNSKLDVNYYFSPQFRLNTSWGIVYNWQDSYDYTLIYIPANDPDYVYSTTSNYAYDSFSSTFRKFNQSLNVSLIYSIF